jgi:phosphoenolpyruvate mutase
MEAHNGLSARIVEAEGFEGIWASGLSISTALGVRDANEASWTQVLDVAEFMVDATSIPVMLDGDTGFGNFNNARRLIRKLCQRQIAAVCIEDKVFPKTNSFIGAAQELADPQEFSGKIKACKDSQTDSNFAVVARVEALIAGRSMQEALDRAATYHDAGADAILIHSKKPDAGEILTFANMWGNTAPLVIVPTTYYNTPTEEFEKAGISMVIWANHNIRAATSIMLTTCRHIRQHRHLRDIEKKITSVGEIFDLLGYAELEAAKARYLPGEEMTKDDRVF